MTDADVVIDEADGVTVVTFSSNTRSDAALFRAVADYLDNAGRVLISTFDWNAEDERRWINLYLVRY